MKNVFESLKRHFWIATTLIGFAGGFLTNYYLQYRSNLIDGLRQNYAIFQSSQKEIDQTLKSLADVAAGKSQDKPVSLSQFRVQLLEGVKSATDLSRRVGANGTTLDYFEVASVNLANAAEDFTGPKDAKKLVEAASDYYFARQMLSNAVIKEDTKFLW
ncbi:hypothetical protein BRY73_08510 [Ochrobactrum sp. P6BS-III]|uniref:hypothetical protein n=1 Tax=unclassified Ochrobactrum TaxID=239106 RepID=UPI00099310C8|nr:hypothetical protein [Ochrobactrum sp. P6BSIII]OOL18087.1 hypothetical protein BRY73_08510 [Ochrobactrum sp. P6BS-III]